MFDADVIQTILIVLTVLLAGWAVYKAYQRGEEITPTTLVEATTTARPVAAELMEVVQIAVNSVEQLKREGKIRSNDVAFNHALDLAKKWIPDEWEVDNEDLINAINAAVLVASTLSEQAGKSSEDAAQPGKP